MKPTAQAVGTKSIKIQPRRGEKEQIDSQSQFPMIGVNSSLPPRSNSVKIATMAANDIPVVGDGFRADIMAGLRKLRLFSEVYELGHVALVYDLDEHREVSRQDADDLETGKRLAEQAAANYLRRLDGTALPRVEWAMNAQARNRLGQ